MDQKGNLLVAEVLNNRIQIFDRYCRHKSFIGAEGQGYDKEICHPTDVAVTNTGDVVVSDVDNSRLQIFSSDGVWLRSIGSAERKRTQ